MTISRDTWLRDLDGQAALILRRLLDAYSRFRPVLIGHIDNLTADIERSIAQTGTVDVVRLRSYQNLLAAIEHDIKTFGRIAHDVARAAAQDSAVIGDAAGLDLAIANSPHINPGVLVSSWQRASPRAIAQLVDILDSPAAQQTFNSFGSNFAQIISDTIITGIASGRNPLVVARHLRDLAGLPLSWAENLTRTTSLYGYRLGAHSSYVANSDIVEGWVWFATLDNNVCLSCLEQHGTIHSNNEVLNDHHRGRCTPVPVTVGATWMDDVQSGKDWFDSQPLETQQTIMRPSMHRAYTAGVVDFGQFGGEYQNAMFGTMRHELSLTSIIGAENAAEYYY